MRALVVLAELWAASEIVLLAGPLRGEAVRDAVLAAVVFFCCAFTYLVTYPQRSERESVACRRLVPAQLAVTLAIVALTGWTLASNARPSIQPAPWVAILECAALPMVLLFLLRVPLSRMGLGPFTRGSAPAAAIWLVPAALAAAYLLLHGNLVPATLMRRVLYALVAGGIGEEFLFRGALFSRLRAVMTTEWAALAQALLFGFWRFGSDVALAHGTVTALALVVPAQAAFGYAMAILVRRSGNIALPIFLHATLDALRASA